MGAPIKREFLLLYLIIKMSSIFRPQLFPDAFPVKGRQNSVKILHRSQSSLPLISFSSGRGLYFRFTLKVLPKFLSNWHTVFPGIVSPESILFWIQPYVLWPLVTVHTGAETIQGRKLFKGGNYMRKYGICFLSLHILSKSSWLIWWLKKKRFCSRFHIILIIVTLFKNHQLSAWSKLSLIILN